MKNRTEYAYEGGEVSAAEREALIRDAKSREPKPRGEMLD